jgi:hypothetical protein
LITNGPGVAVGTGVGVCGAVGVGLAWLAPLGGADGLETDETTGLDPADCSARGLGEDAFEQAPSSATIEATTIQRVDRRRDNRRDAVCLPTATTPTPARYRPAYCVASSWYRRVGLQLRQLSAASQSRKLSIRRE